MSRRFGDGSAGDADYGTIGEGYARIRQPDPRIAAQFHDALGDALTVLNVGAGAGSYEPIDREVTAIEPSASMRAQRPPQLSRAIDATAEHLPFADESFDASMASVTVHQWPDPVAGLREMRRVTRGPVAILTFDPQPADWWLPDYLPELFAVEGRRMPAIQTIAQALGERSEVRTVLIPADCTDRFMQALFARPEEVLDPQVRRATSAWSFVDEALVDAFVERLSSDLASGVWDERYGHFRKLREFDGGMRLVVGKR